ncbi:MAG: sigma-54-dependent Fis family transcriptional regulator [Gemmatimonadetes bacterium]|nr:sigma-54-dependent Fis family transcriptional regulator [Gemmatimonadota bacterium]
MRILVVDDERTIRFSLAELLESDGHVVREAEHAPAALASLEGQPADLVLSDLSMPAMDGMQLFDEVCSRYPGTLFVLMTAFGDERAAVRALKAGAYDYVPKPFDNEEIRAIVRRAHEVLALRAENQRLREELASEFRGLIGDSPAMREVYRIIRRAGPVDVTTLVTGESGTGKELAARALHAESRRASGPFVALNCSALPGELVESELFGYVRGAFTGADRDREGLIEAANGGTLFLDEIGDLALAAQAKLLRVLEERQVLRLGSTRATSVDMRVIAATHRPLDRLIAEGRFREDLLYRLQVVNLTLPPLRERRGDIPAIAVHFLAEFAQRHGRPMLTLSDATRRILLAHDWPGNVRELRNALERAVVLAEGDVVQPADLPSQFAGSVAPLRPADAASAELPYADARARALDAFDRSFLSAALERNDGNVSATARLLGLHRQSLQKMLRRLEISLQPTESHESA